MVVDVGIDDGGGLGSSTTSCTRIGNWYDDYFVDHIVFYMSTNYDPFSKIKGSFVSANLLTYV